MNEATYLKTKELFISKGNTYYQNLKQSAEKIFSLQIFSISLSLKDILYVCEVFKPQP